MDLETLADRMAIADMMARYAERIDANDPVGSAAFFAEDGVGDYWGEYTGRAAIADRLTDILAPFSATSHHLSNVMIDLAPDRQTATAMSYVYAFHRRVADQSELHIFGRWVDSLKKVDGQWLFAHRKVIRVGSKGRDDDHTHPGHPGRMG